MINSKGMASLTPPSYLIEIIHEHLTHLIDGYRGIYSTVQAQFAHSVW